MNEEILIHRAEFDDFLIDRAKKDKFLSKCVINNSADGIIISYISIKNKINESICIQFMHNGVWLIESFRHNDNFTGTYFDIKIPYCKKSLIIPGTTLLDWCDLVLQEVYQLWCSISPTISDFFMENLKNKPR